MRVLAELGQSRIKELVRGQVTGPLRLKWSASTLLARRFYHCSGTLSRARAAAATVAGVGRATEEAQEG